MITDEFNHDKDTLKWIDYKSQIIEKYNIYGQIILAAYGMSYINVCYIKELFWWFQSYLYERSWRWSLRLHNGVLQYATQYYKTLWEKFFTIVTYHILVMKGF